MKTDEQQNWATEIARGKRKRGARSSHTQSLDQVKREIDRKKILLRDTISSQNLASARVVFDELVALRYELLLATMREARETHGRVTSAQFQEALGSYHRDIRSLAEKLDTLFGISR